ncbi:MAG: hypothetical protein ACRYFL_01280 [Janthinobacterium lividum]
MKASIIWPTVVVALNVSKTEAKLVIGKENSAAATIVLPVSVINLRRELKLDIDVVFILQKY